MPGCEEFKGLLMGLLDDELDADESRRLNEHLIRCASCRADYETLRRTEKKLEAMSFIEVGDEAARKFWRLPYSRALRLTGFAMIAGGYAAIAIVGLVAFLTRGNDGLIERVPGAAIIVGSLILLGMVIIDRVISFKTDPYKDIER